jgi:hypothetical protein
VRRWRPNWSHARDVAWFFLGVGVVIHETVLTSLDREWLLILAAGAMGLPGFRRGDQRRNRNRSGEE